MVISGAVISGAIISGAIAVIGEMNGSERSRAECDFVGSSAIAQTASEK